MNRACLLLLALLLGGCRTLSPQDFAATSPKLDPFAYFTGRTVSHGVFENGRGVPRRRFTTVAHGEWKGAEFILTQDFTYDNGQQERRVWRLRRVDAHRVVAHANDSVGEAVGEAYGNLFRFRYTIALSPGNPLSHVHLRQWMYLQPDGRSMTNHASVTKLGIEVAQVTEHFSRAVPVPVRR